jgi:hypothetical protein
MSTRTGEVLFYFTPLTLLVYLVLPHNAFMDVTTSFILKNDLHASASQISSFRLLTAIPVYLSIVFGFSRDLWNPLGMRDRGYFLVFGAATAAVFILLTLLPFSYAGLFVGVFLAMATFRFLTAAYQGLMALVGQRNWKPRFWRRSQKRMLPLEGSWPHSVFHQYRATGCARCSERHSGWLRGYTSASSDV